MSVAMRAPTFRATAAAAAAAREEEASDAHQTDVRPLVRVAWMAIHGSNLFLPSLPVASRCADRERDTQASAGLPSLAARVMRLSITSKYEEEEGGREREGALIITGTCCDATLE